MLTFRDGNSGGARYVGVEGSANCGALDMQVCRGWPTVGLEICRYAGDGQLYGLKYASMQGMADHGVQDGQEHGLANSVPRYLQVCRG